MKRTRIDIEMIADCRVLARAAVTAASGKRHRADVRHFFSRFDTNIAWLRRDLLSGIAPYNRFRQFTIHDPKQRVITAVSFEDRVVHHAMMIFAAPVLERALVQHSYACRVGKGPLAAVKQAHANIKKHPWYVKIDVAKYFESIDHNILLGLLCRKFKGAHFLQLLERIVRGYSTSCGKGLPIGSLTSQHFANFYLDGLDRLILENSDSRAYVRYMDDMVWWSDSKQKVRALLAAAISYAGQSRQLQIKENVAVQRSEKGITFCGFRIFPGTIKLTRRKKQRYARRRNYWEQQYRGGIIDENTLQRSFDSVKGIVIPASSAGWMRHQLALRPAVEV